MDREFIALPNSPGSPGRDWQGAVDHVCDQLDEGTRLDDAIEHSASLYRVKPRALTQEFNLRCPERL